MTFCPIANDIVGSTVKEVGKQFQKLFLMENIKDEMLAKLDFLEQKINSK